MQLNSGQSQLHRKTLDLFNILQMVVTGVAVSEQTGNVTRPSLAVLTDQKQSFDNSLDNGGLQLIVSVGRHMMSSQQ